MTLHKILKYVSIVIGVIGLILLGRILAEDGDAIEASADLQTSLLNPFMYVAYLVLAIVIALVLVFVIKGLFKGNIKNTLIAVGAFLAVIIIAYLVTDGSQMTLKDGDILSASAAHWISAGLVTFYILAGIAILAMVISGVKKLTK
ncbi:MULTISPECIES: hypothetical protein [Salegentibacter]|jgi:fucose permease|uniref:Uncharacterized protein n=1 Tax=Salegentibacter salarius TaxID=435906 RepID=A0A2N0TT12_9FLAO|nr:MULTISPECIES: hypothetical protein [Salegentibacter]OEY72065.1 hypothetical protein BHS39_14075 [Salegentibacter salarius]PKD17877.1 hypothetical protein APR40_14040 [Salegentibacter salarius]UBZ08381.1 hypothetical protein LDL76_06615 [Salegentibacter mishustinae]SLK05025.1 hypothetical protein SAMN05660445_02917 [Salegentibacter salarius]